MRLKDGLRLKNFQQSAVQDIRFVPRLHCRVKDSKAIYYFTGAARNNFYSASLSKSENSKIADQTMLRWFVPFVLIFRSSFIDEHKFE